MELNLADIANAGKQYLAVTAIHMYSGMSQCHSMRNRIQHIRKSKDWSLQRLADAVSDIRGEETHVTTINKLEIGKQKLTAEWMEWISRALDVHPAKLIVGWEVTEPDYDLLRQLIIEALKYRNGPISHETLSDLAILAYQQALTPQEFRSRLDFLQHAIANEDKR